jgi:tetratricopeptide (TPR) repeat protein
MRQILVISVTGVISVASVLSGGAARGARPGEVVAVVATVDVVSQGRILGRIEAGNTVVVGAAGDEGLHVNFKETGWIDPGATLPLGEAVAHFTGRLQADPQDAEALFGRGSVYKALDQWQKALDDFTAAVELAPDRPSYRLLRAYAATRQGKLDEASADYDALIRQDPLDVTAYRMRAGLAVERGRYQQAVADYNLAVRLAPGDAALNNDRAWLLATCPDPRFRNGEQALRDATVACELSGWKVFNRLATLAAAHAERDDFESAVRRQREAIGLSPPKYRSAQEARLRLYEAGKPYREQPGLWK